VGQIIPRKQDLGDFQVVTVEGFLVDLNQTTLSDSGYGLLLGNGLRFLFDPQSAQAGSNRPGRNQRNLKTLFLQESDFCGESKNGRPV
jgi:hypothetical protein